MQIGDEEIVRNVPLRIIDSQEVIATEECDVSTVNITVRGVSHRRNIFSPSDFKIDIHLPQKDSGGLRLVEFKILRDANIKKPFGLKIISVTPEIITLKIDKRAQKELPVITRFTGSLSEDFACGEVKINPETVIVNGPESLLKNLAKAQTEQIILDPFIKENFERTVTLDFQNSKISFSPKEMLVNVEIYRKYERKTLSGLPVSTMFSSESGISIRKMSPTNVDVTVSGPKGIIENMDGREIIPFVKVEKDFAISERELKVECHVIRRDIKIISVNPSMIKVFVVNEK